MTLTILNNKQKQEIESKLNEQFGIENIPGKIIMIGKERLYLFSGSFTEKQIIELEKITPIEKAGVYFAKFEEHANKIRLSIEGSQILKDQIKKNILELEDKYLEDWMKGYELQIKTGKKDFLIIKHNNDFLGSGKASEEKIGNFIPKIRRLKEKN
jgi:NOL1/NOP2/fmu family ribosome biogenesis protein